MPHAWEIRRDPLGETELLSPDGVSVSEKVTSRSIALQIHSVQA